MLGTPNRPSMDNFFPKMVPVLFSSYSSQPVVWSVQNPGMWCSKGPTPVELCQSDLSASWYIHIHTHAHAHMHLNHIWILGIYFKDTIVE